MQRLHTFVLVTWLSFFSWQASAQVDIQQIPAAAFAQLQQNKPVDLIVEYDADRVQREATTLRLLRGNLDRDDVFITNYRANQYTTLKNAIDTAIAHPDIDSLTDYSHLPMAFKRFRSLAGLQALLADKRIVAVYEDQQLHPVLTNSLPLIDQSTVATAGYTGSGTSVAVIDNGINYTLGTFGYCTGPRMPTSCRVVASQQFGSGSTDTAHGTNVAAIVLGVAPATKIAALDVFSGTSALTSNVINAINWTISNRATYSIVSINMSLGDGSKNTAACTAGNAFYTPITNARNAGMHVIVAAGNEAYTNALSKPACTPGAISVGAVYDANVGGLSWGSGLCTDATTAADQVACFSDSASFLTMLAPGALINAAGITQGGTSQAAPHVAGAVTVLRSAYPSETFSQIETRLTSSGVMITDPRNGITKPRLNLLAAARPVNDAFANRTMLSGNSGTVTTGTLLASKESGEPNHAGNVGGRSLWWKWVAPASGQVSLDTHGSGFDTLLATYTGTTLTTLQWRAANDNDGASNGASGLLFQAQAGAEYVVAVDGVSATSGSVILNWSINTSAQANLSASISGPTSTQSGADTTFTVAVNNAGPQTATNATITIALPVGASFVSGSSNCSSSGDNIICRFDTIANASSASAQITINWDGSGSLSMPVSASSDVPDPSLSDNTTSIQVAVAQTSDNDIPMLPTWALLALALFFGKNLVARTTQQV